MAAELRELLDDELDDLTGCLGGLAAATAGGAAFAPMSSKDGLRDKHTAFIAAATAGGSSQMLEH